MTDDAASGTGRPAEGGPPAAPGVPPRPAPLPPPRAVVPPGGMGAGAPTTVLATGPERPAPARPAVPRPVSASRGRRTRLTVRRLDPWSVFVMSLLLSLCLAVVTMVASLVLYGVLSALGVPGSLNKAVSDVNGGGPLLTQGRFLGFGALVAAANVVLLTTLGTIGALLYNVCAGFAGGVEVTLAERD